MSRTDSAGTRVGAIGAIDVQLAVMARNTELLRRRAMAPDELDRAAYLILRALCAVGSADINGLASVLGLDSSTVGRQINGLAEQGLVTRDPDPDDRRRALIDVSAEGRRLLELTIDLRRRRVSELLVDWDTSDLDRLGSLLARYNAAVAVHYMTGLPALEAEP